MRKIKKLSGFILLCFLSTLSHAEIKLSPELYATFHQTFTPDTHNKASLQRGAKLYFNYCAGCHSLQYETYPNIVRYIGGEALQREIITKTMLFDEKGDIYQTIQSAMAPSDGQQWFGVAPPDLTTLASQQTPSWLYNFLRGFYSDPTRVHGTNNIVMVNTLMPNVLSVLRGEVQPIFMNETLNRLVTVKAGQLSPLAFDKSCQDLVNFFTFIAEPWHDTRIWYGIAICSLLFLLAFVCYYLFKLENES